MDNTLTQKQKHILDFINGTLASKGFSPSLREIGRYFKVSIGTVQDHVNALKRKGHLKSESQHRSLLPTNWKSGIQIPVLGQVQAGMPILAEQNIESYISVDERLCKGSQVYALRIKGDSMIDAGIHENDTAIVRQQLTAQNGDIVVALKETEATVKFFRQKNNQIYLEPANPNYRPLPITGFSIVGKVVGLVRNYGG